MSSLLRFDELHRDARLRSTGLISPEQDAYATHRVQRCEASSSVRNYSKLLMFRVRRIVQGCKPEQRAQIYTMAYMTGLRKRELSGLSVGSFKLDSDPPIVTVEAVSSKHRKKDVLPLHPDLVDKITNGFGIDEQAEALARLTKLLPPVTEIALHRHCIFGRLEGIPCQRVTVCRKELVVIPQ